MPWWQRLYVCLVLRRNTMRSIPRAMSGPLPVLTPPPLPFLIHHSGHGTTTLVDMTWLAGRCADHARAQAACSFALTSTASQTFKVTQVCPLDSFQREFEEGDPQGSLRSDPMVLERGGSAARCAMLVCP